jgi:hypothetical protein
VSDPWADPATPTQDVPYAGPPPTAPGGSYAYPPPGYPQPGWYGAPWAPLPQRAPQRPGQLITVAVLSFVQATIVLVASCYIWFIASLADFVAQQAGVPPQRLAALATEGTVLAVVGLVTVVVLVAAGVLALNRRDGWTWWFLVAAQASQLVLAAYWAVRMSGFSDGLSGSGGGSLGSFALFFAAGPLTSVGLLLSGAARRWFGPPAQDGAQR